MKCPKCGNEMEKGVLSAPGLTMVWSEKPIWSQLSGEHIPTEWDLFKRQHLDGYRCTACSLIIVNYA
jgi:hypothetical protein